MNLTYVRDDFAILPGNYSERFAFCPAGTFLVGGGCGHRDFNNAALDIVIRYSGPSMVNPTRNWRCLAHNTNSSSGRALVIFAICSSASNVSGP